MTFVDEVSVCGFSVLPFSLSSFLLNIGNIDIKNKKKRETILFFQIRISNQG